MTINAKSVSYVAGGADTVATILAGLVAAWTASTIPEFSELAAAGVGAVGAYTGMTLTQNLAGRPTTISVSTSGAATFSIANTVAATGPNFFDNSQNWSGGSAPANSDTLVFDNGSIDCCYNINSSLTGVTLNINPGYSGKIGLPFINSSGSVTYAEYRTTSLTLAGGTAVINAPNINQCNLAFGANTTSIRVLSTGQRLSSQIPVVLITGGNGSSELDVSKGDVATAFYQGTTANFPVIKTGYIANALTDVTLLCGSGTTLATITKNGGNVTVSANATMINQDISGGNVTLTDSVTATTINVYAGTLNLNTVGTVGTINLYGSSTLTADGDPRAKTITNNIGVWSSGVTVTDSQKSINSGTLSMNLNGSPSVNFSHGGNATLVLT
jgi:hypothetical protein